MQLGAQFFTLRSYTQNEKDFTYCIRQVAEMGYQTVQLSAVGPIAPERIREICEEAGVKIVLTHTNPDRIRCETEKVIEEHNIYGCDYIGIGSMPERYRTPEWIAHFEEDYSEAAKKIAASGKLLMYHNHNFEFEKIAGRRMIEILMEAFPKEELGFTLDTYWVQAAGADVCEWIRKLKGRLPCVHLKDMAVKGFEQVMAPVMEGNMNFTAILEALKEDGGVRYLLVEQDVCQESPFVCLKKSYDHLAGLGYR